VNSPIKFHAACICAYLAAALCGTAAAATAQNLTADSDVDLKDRVQLALHADPYFYDGHVEVMVEHGVVHLHGLVFSDWDLRDAIRIATKAAGDRPVINNLTIFVGGRR
jgi:osmotically-inducible protein OsmY